MNETLHHPPALKDPSNLANIYFCDQPPPKELWKNYTYVHPAISISTHNVCHGRGMVATKDIRPGECLFVTPPTVHADAQEIHKEFLKRELVGSCSTVTLEDIAVEILADNMYTSMVENDKGTLNSILVLMGAGSGSGSGSDSGKKEWTRDHFNWIQMTDISTLLGNDDTDYWCRQQEQVLAIEKLVSRDDLKHILFKNAFGPDFVTYEKIHQQWKQKASHHVDYIPPHILGIYPLAAMINHSCVSNATRTYSNEVMIVHASKNIAAGSEIVWSYIPPTRPLIDRRRALKKRHGFICQCEKCRLESSQLKMDVLPVTTSRTLSQVYQWNRSLMDVTSLDHVSKRQLYMLQDELNDTVFSSTNLSNELKRYLRIDIVNFYFNYLNAVLFDIGGISNNGGASHTEACEKLLNIATQLHFAFCASNNGSTEHLSILHLCYELATALQKSIKTDPSLTTMTTNKVRFWTDQLKKAHMVRYGFVGDDVECFRKLLVHTRQILRQRDGFLKVSFHFL